MHSPTSLLAEGVIAINKPVGMSSHDVVNKVRRIANERRVGHAGTLDPLASGVLIVLIGKKATTRQAEFMAHDKAYEAEITFGSTSATDDSQGPITPSATFEQLSNITQEHIQQIIPQFVGTITQIPPAFSAIKIAGKSAYARAREGSLTQEMLAPRTVEIFSIDLVSFTPATPTTPATTRIRIHCNKGVYIRSLARDMGAALGVGAYMSALVRTRVGDFNIKHALSIEQFAEEWKNFSAYIEEGRG